MKRVLQSGLLLFVALLVAGAIGEGLVRIFAPHARDHVVPAGMFEIDPKLGWKLHPGSKVRHRTRYYDVAYDINAMGFRDPPRSAVPPEGKRRVLAFGDSHIFGWGVSPDQKVTAVVEAHNPSLEVWDMGVPGYGLDQEILSYEQSGRLEATDVVLFVTRHTISRTLVSRLFRKPKPRFTVNSSGGLVHVPVPRQSGALTDLFYRVFSPLYLPYFLDRKITRLVRRGGKRRADAGESVPPEWMPLQMGLLLKAKAIADERRQRLTVLVVLEKKSSEEVKDFCGRNGIGFVEAPWPNTPLALTFGEYDRHWTAKAHEIIADRLSAQLSQ